MYEHFDSLYSWAIQHNAQEILGILAFCLAVLVPIAAIVLASINIVLDYALRYINEDFKQRRVILKSLYQPHLGVRKWLDLIGDKVDGEVSPNKWDVAYKKETTNWEDVCHYLWPSSGGWCPRTTMYPSSTPYPIRVKDILRSIEEEPLLTLNKDIPVIMSGILVAVALPLYFLPLWLIVTGATIYGTLRTARFATRVSKKFNKHLEKEHSNETQGK